MWRAERAYGVSVSHGYSISAVLIILYAIVKIIAYLFPGVIEEHKKAAEI